MYFEKFEVAVFRKCLRADSEVRTRHHPVLIEVVKTDGLSKAKNVRYKTAAKSSAFAKQLFHLL